MDREALLQTLEHGPVRVTMNDGSSHDIDGLRDGQSEKVSGVAFG